MLLQTLYYVAPCCFSFLLPLFLFLEVRQTARANAVGMCIPETFTSQPHHSTPPQTHAPPLSFADAKDEGQGRLDL